jgi:hypothetical protein
MSVERTSIEDSLHVDIELKESGDDWLCGAQIATHLLTGATFVEITLARHLQFDKQTQSFNEEFISKLEFLSADGKIFFVETKNDTLVVGDIPI